MSEKDEFGGITMPTKPSTGRIPRQTHFTRAPGEGYTSTDDGQASGYGKMEASPKYTSRNPVSSAPKSTKSY